MDGAYSQHMNTWNVRSPDTPGFHAVITPDNSDCRSVHLFRLNLPKGQLYHLQTGNLEMHPVLIHGSAELSPHIALEKNMERFDSFYLPASDEVAITAKADCIFYIAAAPYEGIGSPCFRRYEPNLPIGAIHQIHGSGVGQREVMFTLDPNTPASRLICGLTWGGQGTWTSWPPHQHERDLEEAYCYFDMDPPGFGLHLSYRNSGDPSGITAHIVTSGSMVQVPAGYHPTVASPAVRNSYLWVLASFSPSQRRYDLAVTDPAYENT